MAQLTEYEKKVKKLKLLERREQLRQELPHLYSFPFYKWTREFMDSTGGEERMKLLVAANQISKALDDDTLIPTPGGYVAMGDLSIGDEVFGRDGKPTKIIAIPFKGKDECYNITFDDGSSVIASGKHDWIVKTPSSRFRKNHTSSGPNKKAKANPKFGKWTVCDTESILLKGNYSIGSKPGQRYSIPLSHPVEVQHKDLFDPYLIGLLIGDGGMTSKSVILTTADQEIADYITTNHGALYNGKYAYRLNGYQPILMGLGLMGLESSERFIPRAYMSASIQERLAVLQGLMDSDGHINQNAVATLSTTSKRLAMDVCELVSSLGGKSKVAQHKAGYKKDGIYKRCKDVFLIQIRIEACPFRLKRKAERFRLTSEAFERIIYSITPVGERACTCITVSNTDGSFLATENYIVTHNSSTLIRHVIDLATDKTKWSKYFPRREPQTFWYVYPDENKVEDEFATKWVKEFLPRGEMKDDPTYGWKEVRTKQKLSIHFNTGVSIIFKTWNMDLQSGTLDFLAVDEELPEKLYPELAMRLNRYNGIFAMVFTATLNQEFWYRAMEMRGRKEELFRGAEKWQISMEHDCQFYEDGTPSPWTPEEVARIKAKCGSQTEIDRRVHGRFVTEVGVKYSSFSRERNVKPKKDLPKDWHFYSGVDIGSGGKNHPAAISIVAVKPDNTYARLVRFWKGSSDKVTTASDILEIYKDLTRDIPVFIGEYYDYSAKDFGTLAERSGFNFQKANKDRGSDMLNVLFKNEMFDLEEGEHIESLITEYMTLKVDASKSSAKDDGIDSNRYAIAEVPWDVSKIKSETLLNFNKSKDKTPTVDPNDRVAHLNLDKVEEANEWDIDREIEEWNDLSGGF